MLKVSMAVLKALSGGWKPSYEATVYFLEPETYTQDDYLANTGNIRMSMSAEGGYEISNTTITLRDKDYYFSRKFARELPVRKRVEVSARIAGEAVLLFTGSVGSWKKSGDIISLDLNASLLEPLKLRTTSVYRNPRDISNLGVVVGDLSGVTVPATPIDKDGLVFHVSDFPMQEISAVYVDGAPASYGFTPMPAWQDETGRSVAAVIFDNPQYEKTVTVSGKGAMKMDTGELIESPADFIKMVLLDIQGYDETSVDLGEISRFYSECLKSELRIACVLDSADPLKSIFDELASNIHAHWLLSDGKSVMRLRSRAVDSPIRYDFAETEIGSPEITSEDIINEITVNFAYDWGERKFRSSLTKHNPLSKVLYGGTFAQALDLRMIQKTRQAEEVIDARLNTYSIPQVLTSFVHDSRSLHLEPGDRVSLTLRSGIGENGFEAAAGGITNKELSGQQIGYDVAMEPTSDFYASELVNLTATSAPGQGGIDVTYENGVATITIYADIEGNPPVEGAEVTINGIKMITDRNGQARFNLAPGRYTALVHASGYEDAEVTFTV